ncbi:hypothetical protein IAE37_004524 [Pseudomonas sp. S31]|uniref:hypothetical protein n=1 Tax=Pseudomonas sp. S31 TaxID=1564473 RepID=UPI00191482D8|nr:hypothetical protein [Pseudomonas sp. S31]MBK5002248.1 hypothetical protein [Pseudomonas sp. S31]
MLDIVPDPPQNITSLEDTLQKTADNALCAKAVMQQAILLQPRSPVTLLMRASMHELEALETLIDSALVQIQMPANPRALH